MHWYRRRIDIGNGLRVLEVFAKPLTEGLQSLKFFQASGNGPMNRATIFTNHKNVAYWSKQLEILGETYLQARKMTAIEPIV
jgi:hypothetical protein